MLVSEIVKRVRSAIDERMVNDSQFLSDSEDEKNLTQIIKDSIGYALQHVIENAPLDRLDGSMFETLTPTQIGQSFSIDAEFVGRLTLPDGLLRIVDARLSSWSLFPIPEPNTSQAYLMQQDKYARGSWDRPVNILNGRTLEMYCAKPDTEDPTTTTDTLIFVFIRKPDVVIDAQHQDPNVTVPARLEASLIYQIAGLAMLAFKEEIAASFFALAQKYDADGLNS